MRNLLTTIPVCIPSVLTFLYSIFISFLIIFSSFFHIYYLQCPMIYGLLMIMKMISMVKNVKKFEQFIFYVLFLGIVTPSFSKYHATLSKVPYHPLQSTMQPSSKYHATTSSIHILRLVFRYT